MDKQSTIEVSNNNTDNQLVNSQLHVAKISDLTEKIHGVVFEGLVLNRYGTFCGNKRHSTIYLNIRADLVDDEGYSTVTLMIDHELVHIYEEYLQRGNYLRIEDFTVVPRKHIEYEKGDASVLIRVCQGTKISILPPKKFTLNFFNDTSIHELLTPLNKEDHGTISVVLLEDGGSITTSNDNHLHLLSVADGKSEDDKAIVTFFDDSEEQKEILVKALQSNVYATCLFKNIYVSDRGTSKALQFRNYTICTPVYDSENKSELEAIGKFWRLKSSAINEVEGEFKFDRTNRPYQHICGMCRKTAHEEKNGAAIRYYCSKCNQDITPKVFPIMSGTISTPSRKITVTLMDEWIKSFFSTEKNIKEYFDTERNTFFKKIATTRICGVFKLTSNGVLTGFDNSNKKLKLA